MLTDAPTLSVLLIEDSEDDAFFFKREFAKSKIGWTVRHASNGRAAIDLLAEAASDPRNFPRLIFLDLKMPVMNGFDVLRWLKTQEPGKRPPVLILSGSELKADRTRAEDLGAVGYIAKPITADDLHRIIAELFPHSQPDREDLAARS